MGAVPEHRAPGGRARAGGDAAQSTAAPPILAAAVLRLGTPLEPAVRREFEYRLGHDFSAVRIHSDSEATRATAVVGARAYTLGRHIAIKQGLYDPSTVEGRRLLAHELTHIVQQAPFRDNELASAPLHGADHLSERQACAGIGAVTALPAPAVQCAGGPQVKTRRPPRVETPEWPPATQPPTAFEPVEDRYDAEGNLVREAGSGVWYLASQPTLRFPIATGYRYQLLPVNPNASFAALKARCKALEAEQLATAEALKGDGKYWFAKVYHFVTHFELQNIEAGVYVYPHMKMQQIVHFHATYAANLAAWRAGNMAKVEQNWRAAFREAEDSASIMGASNTVKNALLPSIEAHVRLDLPRAIAAAYDLHYAAIPGASLDAFRPDFFAMGSVFERATAALNPEIDEKGSDWWLPNWEWLGELGFPFYFSIGLERQMAWEKAQIISRARGLSLDATWGALRSSMGTAHPNLEPFDVGGETITDYDWQTQPGARPGDAQPGPLHEPAPPLPTLPDRLYFKLDRPQAGEALADAVRQDQDLRPLIELAEWTRQVSSAVVLLHGKASSEGPEVLNKNLAEARCAIVHYFLFRAGADLKHNKVISLPTGEQGSEPTSRWRFVEIKILWAGVSKRRRWGPASALPSEARQ